MSEPFIENCKYKVDWNMISRYEDLSEAFIHEFRDRVDGENIMMY